jgi:CHAD domain-containing protein
VALVHEGDGGVDAVEAAVPVVEAEPTGGAVAADAGQIDGAAPTSATDPAEVQPAHSAVDRTATLGCAAERRLRRWHRRIVADWKAFDGLDEASLHALRKRIKRQRYAVEFFAPVLRRRQVERYLGALAAIQDRMGTLNDLLVARARFQPLVASDPAAWFALGWLAARIVEVRALAKPELARLARGKPPTH